MMCYLLNCALKVRYVSSILRVCVGQPLVTPSSVTRIVLFTDVCNVIVCICMYIYIYNVYIYVYI